MWLGLTFQGFFACFFRLEVEALEVRKFEGFGEVRVLFPVVSCSFFFFCSVLCFVLPLWALVFVLLLLVRLFLFAVLLCVRVCSSPAGKAAAAWLEVASYYLKPKLPELWLLVWGLKCL